MSRTRASSRARYRTVMPTFMTDVEDESLESKTSMERGSNQLHKPRILSPVVREDSPETALAPDLNRFTTDSSAEPNSKQTLLLIDSLLPYQRSLQLRKRSHSFDWTDDADSSPYESLTPPDLQSRIDSSESSYASSDQLGINQLDLDSDCHKSIQAATPRRPSNISSAKPQSGASRMNSIKRHHSREVPDALFSTPGVYSRVELERSPALSKKTPNSPDSTILPSQSTMEVSIVDRTSALRPSWQAKNRPDVHLSDPQQSFLSAPRMTAQLHRKRHPSFSAANSGSERRSIDTQYEYVDGVKLDTQPNAAKEKKTGLSLPEVEAKDIRQISIDRNSCDEDTQVYRPVSTVYTPHFARPPPSIGSGHLERARSISPRPVTEPREHIFVDGYSQVCNDQVSDPLVGSSQGIHAKPGSTSSDETDCQSVQGSPRGRPSAIRNILSLLPSPISERSREDLLEDFNPVFPDSAEPPSIGLQREFKEQDNAMTRGLQAAKALIKSIS